jgi:hypothetical protein
MTLHRESTLLDLIQAVSDSAQNDDEVVATVAYLINSGRVRLCGTFAGAKIALRPSLRWLRMNGSAGSHDVGTRERARNCGRSFAKERRGEVDRPPL